MHVDGNHLVLAPTDPRVVTLVTAAAVPATVDSLRLSGRLAWDEASAQERASALDGWNPAITLPATEPYAAADVPFVEDELEYAEGEIRGAPYGGVKIDPIMKYPGLFSKSAELCVAMGVIPAAALLSKLGSV